MEYLIIFKISARIRMLMDKINVAEWFRAKSPSFELFQLDMYDLLVKPSRHGITVYGIVDFYLAHISSWHYRAGSDVPLVSQDI